MSKLYDWLDTRTGWRERFRRFADEPIPSGTGWFFTLGSVLVMLLGIQFLTGIVLAFYYVPAPGLAYQSVRYVTNELAFGGLLRSLHAWGASFVIVAAVMHLARVFFYGSFKAPREVTWMTGVALFMVILAFALSGYLLPWDQKAYWATTVTIEVIATVPLVGHDLAALVRGGPALGVLTLTRWYAAHVLLLPASLIVFVVAHLILMRRHGISGPMAPRSGSPHSFFPWHVMKDTVAMAAIFSLLIVVARAMPAGLEAIANPVDASYVPRPEWYFLSLFQLLKLFPGPLEPIATVVIPTFVVLFLLAVPFLDRAIERPPFSARRRPWTAAMLAIGLGVVTLTVAGVTDLPAKDRDDWGPHAIVGYGLLTNGTTACSNCHVAGGVAPRVQEMDLTHDDDWLTNHLADPVALAPGVRSPQDPAPPPTMTKTQSQSVAAFLRRVRHGDPLPAFTPQMQKAAGVFVSRCAFCHSIAGEGGKGAPDLSRIAARRESASIRKLLLNPKTEFPKTMMPAYGAILTKDEIEALVQYLSHRQ